MGNGINLHEPFISSSKTLSLSCRGKVSKLGTISNENKFAESNNAVDHAAAEDLATDKDGQKT